MTLKQIEYFIKVCELKQISECSKFFGVSQSAMSIAIKNLETSLGGDLFDRRGKSLVINERGKAFLKSITPIYNRVMEIERNMLNENMFEIYITSSKNVGNYLLPVAIADMIENKDKNVHLNISFENTDTILDDVMNNRCDIGLVEGNLGNSDVNVIPIAEDELVIVTGNEELASKSYNASSIKDFNWIIREEGSGTRGIFFDNLGENPNLNIVLELPTTESIKNCIRGKNFVTVLPYFSVKNELGNGIYEVNVRGKKFKRNLYAIYSKDKEGSETFLNIINTLVEKIRASHKKLTA
ncbi:MAG: LysR family transcriptional regulator [Campylobacteraceae bacterium]|nr:LysR family transcriptional regulator [Campylobacteraceae bacterium]